MAQYLVAIHHPDDYDPLVGPEAMSKIRIEDPLFSSILPGLPTLSASSVTLIFLFTNMTSMLMMIAMFV